MSLYLDASVLLPTLVKEPASAAVDAFMVSPADEFLVGDFTAAEVASGLSRLVRMRLIGAGEASARLDDFEVWRAAASSSLEISAPDLQVAYTYIRRFDLKLRAPDALHIAISRRLDATLVTLDRRLADAARELGIAVHIPGG